MLAPRDLPLLPVFVAVANAGSFTAAARELGLAKSVVSHHVRTLEERCGVRLMERSTRRLHLTQVGEQVLDAAKDVLASVRSLEQVVEGHREQPTGTLRITLPLDPVLSALVSPIAAALVRRHASLKAELVFDDAVRDLVKEGFDVAIRLGPLSESSYVVRRLGSEPEVIAASPAILDERPPIEHPSDLGGAPWIVHSALRVRSAWTLRTARGETAQISVRVTASANTVVAMRDLLLAGAGFAIVPRHVVTDDVQAGRLRIVCPAWAHRRLSLHALLPTRQNPPRVRVFLAALTTAAGALGFDGASARAET
jgi:DNA-binding transcriptional LysR family regulator